MSKTLVVRCGALAAGSLGLLLAYTQQQPAPDLTLQKVKGNLSVILGDGGNVAVLTAPEGVLLVDDKFERDSAEILAKVKSLSDQPIRYVLNTHHHGDHTGGNAKLLPSAEIIAHQNARKNMVDGKQPGAPRVTFSDETSVYLGDQEVRARYFGRGHTNGDAVIYFPSLKTVHTGDLFPTGAPFIDYAGGGSAIEWTATLDNILKWDFETVIPGHGPVARREDLIHWRTNMATMRTRMFDLRKQGKTKDEAAKMLKIEDLGWKTSALFERGLGSLYEEVGKM